MFQVDGSHDIRKGITHYTPGAAAVGFELFLGALLLHFPDRFIYLVADGIHHVKHSLGKFFVVNHKSTGSSD